ncbi:phosphorylase [Methylicorpusculum oleiharenae]|uniref:GH36-type glycosyl hydrolase domain-containing protein n=1 Tax=Methylicorpusculum oleiharenae TaxID=1338687 RepID=UPI001359A5DC|nr:glucoamylase family protein [Methylicorpusculum oleiharenae]MCD2450385.1 phosphorylase [Methylicorpusculum oleiharenae]
MSKKKEQRRKVRLEAPGGMESPIRSELFTNEQFEGHAVSLAKAQKVDGLHHRQKLLPRVQENARVLLAVHAAITQVTVEQRAITPAAEWLLDNFHVIEEQVHDIGIHLPESYYQELPKLAEGDLAGYPRVYGIAWAMIAHTDSRFDPAQLTLFVKAYQRIQPLNLGELWAIPITLRVLMLENLRRLAVLIMRAQNGRRLADEFVDEIERFNDQSDKSTLVLSQGALPHVTLRQAFAVQILQRLHDPHPGTAPSLDFLNEWVSEQGLTLDEVVQREHSAQIGANMTVRNIMTSMRAISAFDWREFVTRVSLVDECLQAHHGYSLMDFLTRDRYRHAIEDLARRSPHSELEIAKKVISKINTNSVDPDFGDLRNDPGYYLIGQGRNEFEQEVKFRPPLKNRILRGFIHYSGQAYLGSIGVLTTLLLLSLPLSAGINAGLGWFSLAIITLFAVFPASDIATNLVNRGILSLLSPRHLPRLELKAGIPETLRTFVVVPTLFANEIDVIEQIEQMEVRYLANPDGDVYFALLSDWTDADSQTLPDDQRLLNRARAGVADLNAKYEGNRFFVFHRERMWNPGEGKWMGWERKRGKLHEFNRLLRGAKDTSFLPVEGQIASAPEGVRYVITLDADTRLPIGVVNKLVGTAAHPLNRPVFDPVSGRVVAGYGILQPRITPTLPLRQEHSMFHRIFAGASGMDSYSSLVSEVYQDLFGLGTFTGKGLYDVDIFEAALSGRVPENTQLSHDLFESVFVRCGLVSDIEFFEEFPSHTDVADSRSHRWTRGDWQLLPWIFGISSRGIPFIGRWKMLDNLRRSLSAPAAFFALIAAWTLPDAPEAVLVAFVLTSLAMPALMALVNSLFAPSSDIPIRIRLRSAWEDVLLGLGNGLVGLTLLAHQAWLMVDAIVSTLLRVFVTRRKMLKWVTALQAKTLSGHALKTVILPLGGSTAIIFIAGTLILIFNPDNIKSAVPFLLLWWFAPFISRALSLPPQLDPLEALRPQDAMQLRMIGRRTWRFFSTFVTQKDNYLPPDNFQESPHPVVAHRSSPTNFGLYLLSVVAARDFGWLGLMDAVDRLEATLETLLKLPRLNGHFYNWYDTRDLHALEPHYISTVDSGNLAGHLLTLAQSCREAAQQPLEFSSTWQGLGDSHRLLTAALDAIANEGRTLVVTLEELKQKAVTLGTLLAEAPQEAAGWNRLALCADTLLDLVRAFAAERGDEVGNPAQEWAGLLCDDIRSHTRDRDNLMPWLNCMQRLEAHLNAAAIPGDELLALLRPDIGVAELADRYALAIEHIKTLSGNAEKSVIPVELETALLRGGENAAALTRRLDKIATEALRLFEEMDFKFLYDPDRQLFALGYQASEGVLDGSYYDLLASEARLTSLIAIAKRDVTSVHWFHLGRRVTHAVDGPVLLSWSGSMFEYLMPSLVSFTPRYSLLDQTCRRVVKRQIQYGQERKVPWGISESAMNQRDLEFTYQYSAFGVPGLGMKRGLAENLVIAPYASALAAMYQPQEATENFARLEKIGALGRFGFFEALDFTPARRAENQAVAIVRCYMAHHQGMSLVALANVIFDGVMRHRFHAVPIIRATDLLLQERSPRDLDTTGPKFTQVRAELRAFAEPPVIRKPSPTSAIPSSQLLSNGRYTVMITAAGSGYSTWGNLAVTRWREDSTRDDHGSYIYLRDCTSGRVWSAGYQPTTAIPDKYEAVFLEDRVRISRTDSTVSSTLEIVISPDDDAEIRRLSLTNNGTQSIEIDITSYAEIVLAPQRSDIAHPAFSNLFIQTEYVPQARGLIAKRRPRSSDDPSVWAAHLLSGLEISGTLQYETDRARFIGRGHTIREPISVMDDRPLSNTIGPVLDPVFSLRTRVHIEPGATAHATFTTIAAPSRETLEKLVDKYRHASTFEDVSALAWTHAQVQLHYLGIRPDEAHLFQILANHLTFADPSLRPPGKLLQLNRLNVTGLWRHGISGDHPILLLRVSEAEDRMLVCQLLRAHEYWGMKHIMVDLVIVNDKTTSYADELQTSLENLVHESQCFTGRHRNNENGSIFVLRADQLPEEELLLLTTAARAVLVSSRGILTEQLLRHQRPPAEFISQPAARVREEPGANLIKIPELEFFNGLGGFADDGREYVIVLDKGQFTPSPWINVIANADFGFMVSESGSGCTWCLNSHENQLTPWSNDPVSDPSGEVFYLCDEENGDLWTPTALPIRIENASYIIRHGQGYSRFEHLSHGIYSELLQFVSIADPIKISRLKIKNMTGRARTIKVAAYVEWVLGASRTDTAPYIVTEVDAETGALFASNPWSRDFGTRIAFADLCGRQTAWTGNRSDFIGRNGNLSAPAYMNPENKHRNRTGAGLDPCAALETRVELGPYEQIELVFLLGQGDDRKHAQQLISRYRAAEVHNLFHEVKYQWEELLTKVQVKTPDRGLDLMLNRWLPYQTLSCRVWARAAFYQAGGAYGFRDQLQDVMALTVPRPDIARTQILRAAARQFPEGDVQHWWHPPTGRGVRTHFSDDRIWLPYVVSHYLKVSGDTGVLDETSPFLEGPVIEPGKEDAYFDPIVSDLQATLFEHCARALDVSLSLGIHGLPLIGSGDWNDGMNRIGQHGKGESVWLAWFLIKTLSDFAPLAEARGETERSSRWTAHVAALKLAVEKEGWDGAWYRRAFYDDGTPLGSAADVECRIDSIAQSWAVISGAAEPERARRAMHSVHDYLIRHGDDLILLFTPPFDQTQRDPGYIKGYLPGVRENGGQYTHAAIWTVIAYAMLGQGDQAAELLRILNPVNRTASPTGAYAYKVEPYVMSADIYAEPPHARRGGWTWYTGAAGWFYRAGLEQVLGLQVNADHLHFKPCIPGTWRSYNLSYRHGKTLYEITVDNPNGVMTGIALIELDGEQQPQGNTVTLLDDGNLHHIRIEMGALEIHAG